MAGLVEHSILNGIDNDLVNAIESVGGDTSGAVGVVDLANVIRTQLVSKDTISTVDSEDWLFGSPETNNVWEKPTTSESPIQAKVTAQSIKQLYDLMINSNRFLIRVVDELPEVGDLNTTYLRKQEIQETKVINTHIDISQPFTTFDGSVGRVEQTRDNHICCETGKAGSIMTITPSSQGEVGALFGWDGFIYNVKNYDNIVIKTNILAWGPTGVQYSLNGTDFHDITSDCIKISKEQLKESGISTINKIVFKVDSVNKDSAFVRIKVREIYFEKIRTSYVKYTAHHFVKEGDSFKRIDFNDINIDFDDLFYATREELVNSYAELNRYYSSVEDILKEQLGHYMEDGNLSLKDTVDSLQSKVTKLEDILSDSGLDNTIIDKLEKVDSKFNEVDSKLEEVDTKLEEVDSKFNEVDTKLEEVDTKLEEVDSKFNEVDTKLEEVDSKFNEVDSKLEEVDSKFNEVDSKLEEVDSKFNEVDTKLEEVDSKLEEVDTKLDETTVVIQEINNTVNVKLNEYDQKLETFVTIDKIATEEESGLMSSEDKKKLNSIEVVEAIPDDILDEILTL